MHKEILTIKQKKLLPLLKEFSADFGLAGGTAIALHIGHRQSIDFDLFSLSLFDNFKIRNLISKQAKIEQVLQDEKGQYTVVVGGVRLTFLYYPFKIVFDHWFDKTISLPSLLTLAATKAYALGRRAKWKDYVDLYFIMKKFHSLREIVKEAKKIFGFEFNEKTFRSQLAYFSDIDYSEKIIYQPGWEVKDEEIKKELINFSLQ